MSLLVPRSLPRRLAVVGLTAALAVGAVACSSDSDGATTTTTAAPPETTTTVPATTTAPPAATTTAPAAATGLPDAEGAAQALYDAWKADDKVAAATVADQAAIDGMWLTAPGDYSLYNHCDTGEFDFGGCLYRGDGGTIQIDLEKRAGNWVVAMAFYAAL